MKRSMPGYADILLPMHGAPQPYAVTPPQWLRPGSVRQERHGLALNSVDYLKELPYFAAEVLPRLERLGLRSTSPRLV